MIVVSTSRGLYDLGKRRFFHEGSGPYFGLTKYKDNLLAIRRGTQEVLFFNRELELFDSIKVAQCHDAHGIEAVDDKLYCLSTSTNEVIEVDLNTKSVTNVFKDLIRPYPPSRRHQPHVNTIEKIGEHLYIMAHRDHVEDKACVYQFDPTQEHAVRWAGNLGTYSHSLLEHQNQIWTCDSQGLKVFSIQNPEENCIEIAQNNMWARGLAVDDFFYIGLSAASCRAQRHGGVDAGILCLDKDSFELCNEIKIENCGQINEILLY